MKLLLVATLLLAGCLPPIGGHHDARPEPHSVDGIKGAASTYAHTYAPAVAAALREVSKDCKDFKSWGEFQDAIQKAVDGARQETQTVLNYALTKELDPANTEYDADKAAAAVLEAAEGFDK